MDKISSPVPALPPPQNLLLDEWNLVEQLHLVAPPSPFETVAPELHDMGLCSACNLLDLEVLKDGVKRVHLNNVFELLKTTMECRLCTLVASTPWRRHHYLRRETSGTPLDSTHNIPLNVRSQTNGILDFSFGKTDGLYADIYLTNGLYNLC